jgi:uncharacterized protein YbbC (DUF1343 family)
MKQALLILTFWIIFTSCSSQTSTPETPLVIEVDKHLALGAERLEAYLPLIKGKQIALAVNHTSRLGNKHLVDTLLDLGISIKKVFAPEHGFRGAQEAGEHVESGVDPKTGLPIVSLYGANKKPTADQLEDIDLVLFDVQDVGVRFYTYISTMHYLMEACAENQKTMLVLDRPNPNGDYVAGPILQNAQKSFVGMHPIPIVHGLTVGELARMINGERWLTGSESCHLEIIPMKNYHHQLQYSLPVKPSPNLPTDQSIRLYPSLCLFEGSKITIGRGTYFPFQVYGHPTFADSLFSFTPESIPGMDQNPKYKDEKCHGWDLRKVDAPKFTLRYLIKAYQLYPDKSKFFRDYFNLLSGNNILMEQIKKGLSEEEIQASWTSELDSYKKKRKKYLLYPETANDQTR